MLAKEYRPILRSITILAAILFPFAAVSSYYLGKEPALFGISVAFALALGNFYASALILSRATENPKAISPALILFGFVGRLTLIGLFFFLVSRISQINLFATLITFVLLYTVLAFSELKFASRTTEASSPNNTKTFSVR